MVKRIIIFKTKPGVPRDRLRSWWAEHTEMARKMEGLKGYVTNLVLEELQTKSGLNGMAEFWFDTRQHHDWAYDPANPFRRELSKHGEPVVDIIGVYVVEERVIIPPPHKT